MSLTGPTPDDDEVDGDGDFFLAEAVESLRIYEAACKELDLVPTIETYRNWLTVQTRLRARRERQYTSGFTGCPIGPTGPTGWVGQPTGAAGYAGGPGGTAVTLPNVPRLPPGIYGNGVVVQSAGKVYVPRSFWEMIRILSRILPRLSWRPR